MALRPRSELQLILEEILGSNQVYFQPPSTVQMSYPCIIYTRDDIDIQHADNVPYKHKRRYLVTVVSMEPDNDIIDALIMLPTAKYGRSYAKDYLNHDTVRLHF